MNDPYVMNAERKLNTIVCSVNASVRIVAKNSSDTRVHFTAQPAKKKECRRRIAMRIKQNVLLAALISVLYAEKNMSSKVDDKNIVRIVLRRKLEKISVIARRNIMPLTRIKFAIERKKR